MIRRALFLLLAMPLAAQEAEAPGPAELARKLLEPEQRKSAAVALLRLGEGAVPALAGLLADAKVPAEGEGLLARGCAIDVLYHLGPAALPATDALLACLERKDHQSLRARILLAIGHCLPWHHERAKTVELAIGKMAGDDFLGTTNFFATLSRLQFDATTDTAGLLAALSHKNGYVRELAAEALELGGGRAEARTAMLAALREALQADHPQNFELKWKWNDRDASTSGGCENKETTRVALSRALLLLDPLLPETVPGHRDRLKHLDPRVRQEAARTLGLLGQAAADAAGPLVAALDDQELSVAREAATALGLIGDQGPAVRQGLEAAARNPDKQLTARARAALKQLERGR